MYTYSLNLITPARMSCVHFDCAFCIEARILVAVLLAVWPSVAAVPVQRYDGRPRSGHYLVYIDQAGVSV